MFLADLMIGTDNRAFEKTPDVLNGVSVNVSTHPFTGAPALGIGSKQ
jgi:hypothetical protein